MGIGSDFEGIPEITRVCSTAVSVLSRSNPELPVDVDVERN